MAYNDIEIAKRLEANSEWSAADIWGSINRVEDAQSCRRIAGAVRKGDEYRKECAPYYGELNLGLITKEEFSIKIAETYKKHFN